VHRLLLRGAPLALPLLACSGLNLPQGPQLADLDAAYDNPEGLVDDETIAAVAALALSRLDAILGLGRLDFVTESLTEVSEVVKETVRDDGDTHFRIKAVTSVEKVCPGEPGDGGMGGVGGADNGLLTYTMRIEKSGILDTVWGEFESCRFPDPGEIFPGASHLPRMAGSIVTYDGSMDIYLGGNLQLAELEFRRFLFRLDGTLELGSTTVDVALDFRLQEDGRTEIRVPAEDGDVVFSFRPKSALVGLEAGDGSYCCDFGERACALANGNDCQDLQLEDRVLRW
jgi:hypothetical protein